LEYSVRERERERETSIVSARRSRVQKRQRRGKASLTRMTRRSFLPPSRGGARGGRVILGQASDFNCKRIRDPSQTRARPRSQRDSESRVEIKSRSAMLYVPIVCAPRDQLDCLITQWWSPVYRVARENRFTRKITTIVLAHADALLT